MAQRSHVPKFGNWDGETLYTACFENARKGKGARGRILNPNYPEERLELMRDQEQHHVPRNGDKTSHNVRPTSPSKTWSKSTVHQYDQLGREHQNKGLGGAFAGHVKSPYRDRAYNRGDASTNAQRGQKDEANVSSFASVYAGSSLKHAQRKDLTEQRRYDFLQSTSPRPPTSRSRTQNNPHVDVQHQRVAASVPKFGAWDDLGNPQLAAGFTVIFDKVKEEKQKVATTLPGALNSPRAYSPVQEIRDNKSTKPKVYSSLLFGAD